MPYDAVVFDADGVLVEPTAPGTLETAIRQALAEHGVEDPPAETVHRLTAVTPSGLREIADEFGMADPAAFWRARDNHASAAQRTAIRRGEKTLYDDVQAVLDLPLPRAVVSNNQQATVDFVLEHGGITDRFDPVFGRAPTLEDVERKKPEPYYLEKTIDALSVDRPLFVGDSNVDLAAASAAGVDAAFIRRKHRVGYELDLEPAHVIESLAELPSLVGSEERAASDD